MAALIDAHIKSSDFELAFELIELNFLIDKEDRGQRRMPIFNLSLQLLLFNFFKNFGKGLYF